MQNLTDPTRQQYLDHAHKVDKGCIGLRYGNLIYYYYYCIPSSTSGVSSDGQHHLINTRAFFSSSQPAYLLLADVLLHIACMFSSRLYSIDRCFCISLACCLLYAAGYLSSFGFDRYFSSHRSQVICVTPVSSPLSA